jgi:hypothetical protein
MLRFVSFRFVFQELDVWRFVSWEPSVRCAEMIGSFRFVSFPFPRRFVTSVNLYEEKLLCWRRACGSGGLERIVDVRVCKSNV